ncbi:unnamed protein product, partial [Sphacelaria rigidula]
MAARGNGSQQQSSDNGSERGSQASSTVDRIAQVENTMVAFGRLLERMTQRLDTMQISSNGVGGAGGVRSGDVIVSSGPAGVRSAATNQPQRTGGLQAADLRGHGGSNEGPHGSSSGATRGTPGARGPQRESPSRGGHDFSYGVMMQGMYEGGFSSGFKPEVPKYTGKEGDFERFRQSFISYARHLRLDWVFTGDCELIHVGDPSVAIEELEAQYGRDVVSTNVRAWHLLSASLTEEVDQDILFRVHSPREAWDALVEARSPKTQGARLALLSKIDNVTVAVDKDPIVQLVELESTARRLRCYEEFKHLNDSLILSKFLNALPPEYEIQRQMLEGVKGP